MSSWSSWLSDKVRARTHAPQLRPSHRLHRPAPLAQVAEVSDGLQDFSAQLQADTSEVSRETRETVEQANVQLAHKLERVTEQLDAAQLGQSISTLGAQVSEQAGRALGDGRIDAGRLGAQMECVGGTVIKDLAGVITQAEVSATDLLSRGASIYRTATGMDSAEAGSGSSTRHEERVRAMQSDESTFLASPADVGGFEQWRAGLH